MTTTAVMYKKQGSISSTFYAKLLHEKISQKRKKYFRLDWFFVLLRSARIKVGHKMLVKSTPAVNYSPAVKLCYNDHGYNEFTAIKNKYNSTFLVPNGTFTT